MGEAWATHNTCIDCYLSLNPDARLAEMVTVVGGPIVCCYCGELFTGGIMMRARVADMPHCTMPNRPEMA